MKPCRCRRARRRHGVRPELPYRCSRRVALRPEPFGALAYHYGTRRLSFGSSCAGPTGCA
ncbi:mycofactocin biosynthesis chaperone MftB [Streptomyces sp. NPDC019531]|uniref:mycofactocin biosynthesis chaperone MftB n=1 Tax=Streptomyces sp. NPDC019531 TaxID=3365062 RepID=UPI003850E699